MDNAQTRDYSKLERDDAMVQINLGSMSQFALKTFSFCREIDNIFHSLRAA
jgi:hypothetical protein